MSEFICRLGTPSGDIVTRVVEATGATDARVQLEREGFKVFAVSANGDSITSFLPFVSSGKRGRVKQSDFLHFNQQLSALLRAGIPMLQSITLLKTRTPSSNLREVLTDVEDKIKSGIPLSQAFEAQGIFPKIYTASILSGEKSGALDDVLMRYVEYLTRSVGVTRKLRGALAYPAFLVIASLFMITFLTLYIVPRMSDLFKNLSANGQLPTITVVVLAISTGFASNAFWLIPLVLLLALGLF